MKQTPPIRVMVVDDHPVVREGLISLLSRFPDVKVVAEAGTGHQALDEYFRSRPDVTLMDLRMPGIDGIEVIGAIRERDAAARIVVLSTFADQEDVYRSMRAGAKGYVLKDAPIEEILRCIRAVHGGETWITPRAVEGLAARVGGPRFTKRELEVLHLMVSGLSNKEISDRLDITAGTVKVHAGNIFKKLGVTSRTQAITAALKRGITRFDSDAA